jgi:hypothetical protein
MRSDAAVAAFAALLLPLLRWARLREELGLPRPADVVLLAGTAAAVALAVALWTRAGRRGAAAVGATAFAATAFALALAVTGPGLDTHGLGTALVLLGVAQCALSAVTETVVATGALR